MFVLVFLLILSFLLLISSFLSCSETALFSLSSLKVRSFKNDKNWKKQLIAELLSKPQDLLVTILISNISINLLIQNVFANLFHHSYNYILIIGLPFLCTVVLGEAIPKSIAISNNLSVSTFSAPIIFLLEKILNPFRRIFTFLASKIARNIFFFFQLNSKISCKELQCVLISSQKNGIINQREAQLIQGVLKIEEGCIKSVMTPRNKIPHYDITRPISQLFQAFKRSSYDAIIIVEKELDNLLGVLSISEFLFAQHRLSMGFDVKNLVRNPFFVPETLTAWKILYQMQHKGENLAVVVDEYGQISGIIAREEIVDIVFSPMHDDEDNLLLMQEEKMCRYTKQNEDSIICDGLLKIHELEKFFRLSLPRFGSAVTIGGWLIEKDGSIPRIGEKIYYKNLLFHVLSASPRAVSLLHVHKLKHKKKLL